ncbi:alpha-E domain-containing protein [Verrucomicrobiales bacterium BCK34]|nr:alpha-E domain-containing protein [Verrucomicrobiales bacterium BCK34]
MLSRVAENLYWMSRNLERADNLSRLVIAHQSELLDATASLKGDQYEWHPLLEVTAMGDSESDEDLLTYMVSSEENTQSILKSVFFARENARAIRDQIAEEMWIELNSLWLELKQIDPTDWNRHKLICEMTQQSSLIFRGIEYSSLPRTDVWAFVQLGEYLERADKTSRIVDLPHFLPKKDAASAWNTMLRASSATAEHRQRYGGEVNAANASSLLLFSSTFPRSVRYCVKKIDELLHFISGTAPGDYLNEAEREAGALLARLNFSGVEEIGEMGLHDYVDSIQVELNQIGWEIMQRYFLLCRDAPPSNAEAYVTSRMQAQQQVQKQG